MRRTDALLEFPVTKDTVIYTEVDVTKAKVVRRFAARYKRSQSVVETLQTALPKNTGVIVDWNNADFAQHLSDKISAASQRVQEDFTPWVFDEKVAEQFDQIATTSIPNYWQVLEKTVNIAKHYPKQPAKIIDIGCATGNTLRLLHDAGFNDLVGVDSSEEMLKKANIPATLVVSESLPVEYGPFDIVIANWVLHFIDNRLKYMQDVFANIKTGGYFILTEKVSTSQLTNDLYFDFKRKQGLSDEEIEEKRRRLAGILRTYPLNWYLETLEKIGYSSVEVFDASFSFVSILAVK
jgi:SAM-dependent methyltransferase